MPHVLHFESKRNGATAFLEANSLLGTLVIMDAFADPYGNFWASSHSEFVFDDWIDGKLPDSKSGALNEATGKTHPTLSSRRTALTKHGCIEHLAREIVNPLYRDKAGHEKPPKGVHVYHITGSVQPCDDPNCELNCRKFLQNQVKVFYFGSGDRALELEPRKESLPERSKESLPKDSISRKIETTEEDKLSTPSGGKTEEPDLFKHWSVQVWTKFRSESGRDKYHMPKRVRPEFVRVCGDDPEDAPKLEQVITEWMFLGFRLHNYKGISKWFQTWKELGFRPELAPWIAEAEKRKLLNSSHFSQQATRAGNYPQQEKTPDQKRAELKHLRTQMIQTGRIRENPAPAAAPNQENTNDGKPGQQTAGL